MGPGHLMGIASTAEEPPMLRAMARQAKDHPLLARGYREFPDHVAVWPHLRRRPLRERAIVHGEAIMVLGDRDDEARP